MFVPPSTCDGYRELCSQHGRFCILLDFESTVSLTCLLISFSFSSIFFLLCSWWKPPTYCLFSRDLLIGFPCPSLYATFYSCSKHFSRVKGLRETFSSYGCVISQWEILARLPESILILSRAKHYTFPLQNITPAIMRKPMLSSPLAEHFPVPRYSYKTIRVVNLSHCIQR